MSRIVETHGCGRVGRENGRWNLLIAVLASLLACLLASLLGCARADPLSENLEHELFPLDKPFPHDKPLPMDVPQDSSADETLPPPGPLPARWTPPFPDHPLALNYVAGKKETAGEQFLQLRLAEPLVGRWRLAAVGEPPAVPTVEPSDLRLEVRLLPRSLPRWRIVGSSMLNASQDTSWIEFIGNKSDQVLKLKVDCQWTDSLRLVVTPYFQILPDATPVPLTPANREKVDQFTQWHGRRIQTQLQWLAARSMAPGAGGNAKKGNAGGNLLENRKLLEQQWKQIEMARARFDHLSNLQRSLEQEGRLHVRLTQFTTGAELAIEPCDPTA